MQPSPMYVYSELGSAEVRGTYLQKMCEYKLQATSPISGTEWNERYLVVELQSTQEFNLQQRVWCISYLLQVLVLQDL